MVFVFIVFALFFSAQFYLNESNCVVRYVNKQFNGAVDFIEMIKHVRFIEFGLMSTLYGVVQRLCYRKRRHVTSCYTYSSHGLFYILFLLIYGNFLMHSPTIILADTTMSNVARASSNQHEDDTKIDNNLLVAAIKVADVEDEYFEDDQEEKEYQELISNKSGEFADFINQKKKTYESSKRSRRKREKL